MLNDINDILELENVISALNASIKERDKRIRTVSIAAVRLRTNLSMVVNDPTTRWLAKYNLEQISVSEDEEAAAKWLRERKVSAI